MMGVSKNTLIAYEKDERWPGADFLNKLLELHPEISPAWLLAGEGVMRRDDDELPPGAVRPLIWESEEDLDGNYYLIPRYDVHADCGGGAVVPCEQVVEKLAFVKRWVNAHHQPADLFLVTAQGDSMVPTIQEGDILLVDKSRQRGSDDGIYILSLDHELVAKRLQWMFDGSVRIVSDNTAYKEQLVPAEQIDRLNVVGRVVWKGGKM
jgi:phage repressor protein C with HTH and peptisase S24 domain